MPDDDLVVEVIEAIAQSDNQHPSEVEFTLTDYIDPEVLMKLTTMEGGIWEFTFRVSDHQVRLTHNNTIFVDGVKRKAGTARKE